MLEFVKGNFFDFDAEIRINTVNCVGVMGAGVALAFKNKYPAMYKDYVRLCKKNEISPGNPTVWIEGDMFSKGLEIINFPTKDNWRNPSKYEYIESGLIWLANYLKNKTGMRVTLPALGCGHGGLDWEKVKLLILKHLETTPSHVFVFEPEASRNINKKSFNSHIKMDELQALGIDVLSIKDSRYPTGLIRYTEKNLYLLGDKITEFDASIISSTSPNTVEQVVVRDFIIFCQKNNLSILFGGSAFDKRMASFAVKKGIVAGVFLPSGIVSSAEKMHTKKEKVNISVMSTGDPFSSFDRKEYIPSVLGRIFSAKFALITTDKLKWLKSYAKLISENNISSYYINHKELTHEDSLATKVIHSKSINIIHDGHASFDEIMIEHLKIH